MLLYRQIDNYKFDNDRLMAIDSLRMKQIENFRLLANTYDSHINDLNKQIKKEKRILKAWRIGGVTVSASLLLFLLFK